MRAVITVALALALPMAVVRAPFAHAHPDERATDHHNGYAIHAHLSGHASSSHTRNEPSLGTDDHDRALYVNAFVAVPVASFSVPDVVPTTFQLAAPAERAAHRPLEIVHTHDPPALGSRPSRAPPFILS
jgi:hypothetical protein